MKYNLPTSQEKSKYVESKFGEIAQKYDLFNDIITFGLHRYWKKFMVKQTGLNKGNKCLDLCCGTGDISHEVFRQYPDCHVVVGGARRHDSSLHGVAATSACSCAP